MCEAGLRHCALLRWLWRGPGYSIPGTTFSFAFDGLGLVVYVALYMGTKSFRSYVNGLGEIRLLRGLRATPRKGRGGIRTFLRDYNNCNAG